MIEQLQPTGNALQDAARARVAETEYVLGYVVVGRQPRANAYEGVVEHSFSMGTSATTVRLWRIRKDGFEGRPSADHYRDHFNQGAADGDCVYETYDIDDPGCPVGIDWIDYERRLVNGRMDKYGSRNPVFFHRGDDEANGEQR